MMSATEPCASFRDQFNCDWTNPQNQFSNPISRAVRCTMEVEDLVFFKDYTQARSLFQACIEEQAWNPSIGCPVSPKTAEKASRICKMNFENAQKAIDSIDKS